jgi:hypothetical protein
VFTMAKNHISNMLLVLGVVMLATVGLMEIAGIGANPLVPAFSALFIGGTAVIDRVGVSEIE